MKPLLSTRYPFTTLPNEYGELCRSILLPRPIRDRAHYRETRAVTDAMAGHRLNRDQSDYFELLCDLIESWERDHEPRLPDATPLQTVLHLMEANGMTGADLGRLLGVSRSQASRILSGERQLTPAHIVTLARRFHLNPAVFLPSEG
jgi:HTH-type transcriptional regulator/antitoxin HigA